MAQEVIKIRGGRTLNGKLISVARNSAVAIIPNIISSRTCEIRRVTANL